MDQARGCYFLLLIYLAEAFLFPTVSSAGSHVPLARQQVCAEALANFRANPSWLQELRDPILNNQDEIRDRVTRYGVLYRCLASGDIAAAGAMVEVDRLLKLFMLLVGGSLFPEAQAGAQNFTLTFADIQDPVVRILREEMGIPAPPGLVYIWLYPSREDMPNALQEYVQNASVRGMTLQTRYIIVFDDVQPGAELEEYQRARRSEVLSHEFVHAYVKAYLGPGRGFSLPTWYDEGLAIYLSGSSESTSASYFDQNGRQVTWSIPPKEYARYRDNFLYLEQMLGREHLLLLIRSSILEGSPELLLQRVGLADEEQLFTLAEAWRIRRGLTRLGLFAGIPLLVGLLFAVVHITQKKRAARIWAPPLQSPVLPPINQAFVRTAGKPVEPDAQLARFAALFHPRNAEEAVRTASERYFAALSLARLDFPQVCDALLGALEDENTMVRAAAARSLGEWASRVAKRSQLDPATRSSILSRLFPLLERDPANEVRWASAEALFQVSGSAALRPIQSAARRWSAAGDSTQSALHQGWYVHWAFTAGQPQLLVDAYRWCGPEARQAIIRRLRSLPEESKEALLSSMLQSSDMRLRELADVVFR